MNAPIRFAPLVVLLVCAVPLRAAEPPVNLAYEPYVVWNDRGIPNGRLGFLKANGTSTRGNYAVVVRGPYEAPGPEAHTHSHVFEGWYILQGSLKFQSRERIFDAPPFTFVLVPPGVEHRFWTEPGQLVQVVQILAPPGFENFFDERLELPGFDSSKPLSAQSAEWKQRAELIAKKYGGGPSEHPTNLPPLIIAPWGQDKIKQRVLATSQQTGGHYTLREELFPPNNTGGIRRVTSKVDNAWFLISGLLTVEIRDPTGTFNQRELHAGGFLFLPRGTEYSFANVASEEDAHLLHWESTPRIPAP